MRDLAESIRTYGVLQPLVVTRREIQKENGGLAVEYELISGERRLRAAKLAGVQQVPAIIRTDGNDAKVKLELAIIENLQREDLNPVDRARAFQRLVDEFSYKHLEIASKVGKSREYVSNTLRILTLPEQILLALAEGKINEGHTRPLLMLIDRPDERDTLFKDIMLRKLTVREAEAISRRIAYDRVRKKNRAINPEIMEMEERLSETLGTRVQIERREKGGKIMIDFFSPEDLNAILGVLNGRKMTSENTVGAEITPPVAPPVTASTDALPVVVVAEVPAETGKESKNDSENDGGSDGDIYSVNNFSV